MAAHEYRSGANELNLACPNNLDHSIANRGKFRIGEIPYRAANQTRVRREQLSWPRKTCLMKRTAKHIRIGDLNCIVVAIGIARNLAENPIAPSRFSQHDRRTQL
jgi:hypothetical protein